MPFTANGIYYADTSTPMSAEAISAAEATSVNDVIQELIVNNRQLQDYLWPDAAARSAQTGMQDGDEGYQVDTKISYRYYDGAWRVWSTLTSFSFTPTWVNLTVGNGTQDWVYNIAAGRVFVSGNLLFGSTTAVTGTNFRFSVPVPGIFASEESLGQAIFNDAGVRYHGEMHYDIGLAAPLARVFTVSGANILDTNTSATSPFTWAVNDRFSASFSYRAATTVFAPA